MSTSKSNATTNNNHNNTTTNNTNTTSTTTNNNPPPLSSFIQSNSYLFPSSLTQDQKNRLTQQLELLNHNQGSRGLQGYCSQGKTLMTAANQPPPVQENNSNNITEAELGERLKANTPIFEECEEAGMREIPYLGFIIVAGGLGERLNGTSNNTKPQVKALLATELITRKSFLQVHCDWIEALQHRARVQTGDAEWTLPIAVMTSDDTHDAVVNHLTHHSGMLSEIIVMKQEKVACFADKNGKLAIDPNDPGKIICKPHGHGDIHILMHKSGAASRWAARGIRHVIFLQDSNILAGRAILASVGNSVRHSLDINMVAVERRPGEQIGAICSLYNPTTRERRMTNIEYNLIEKYFGTDNNSRFPGNINILVVKCSIYAQILHSSEGIVPEFVNPKYDSKGDFQSPVRLECMMQDLPILFPTSARVGFTELERFLCFSAVKNNLKDAVVRFNKTGFPESASSAESDFYASGRRLLAMAGINIRTTGMGSRKIRGIPFDEGAKIVLSPSFGVTVAELRNRFPSPEKVQISDRSVLHIDGNIEIQKLVLDGALFITAVPGARIVIKNLRVMNQGCSLEPFDEDEIGIENMDAAELLRGYRLVEIEGLRISASQPGEVVVDRG
jgi:UDP-sugar pyrophosphorylase